MNRISRLFSFLSSLLLLGIITLGFAAIMTKPIENNQPEAINDNIEVSYSSRHENDTQEEKQEPEADTSSIKNSENEKVVSKPVQSSPIPATTPATSNASGLPDTISRYEWERQSGWKKLVEAAYFKAVNDGPKPMYNALDWTVMYYQITAVATDPCYATLEVALEVDGETHMRVVAADLISAPGSICDPIRSQTITVPPLRLLTEYLRQAEAQHGFYQNVRGSSGAMK